MISVVRFFVILACAAMLGNPARAQGIASVPPAAPAAPTASAPETAPHDYWTSENVDRQKFRETMEEIRKGYEDLERDQDALLDKCVNVTSAQAAQCAQERLALHARRAALHERMHALHEAMEADRLAHMPAAGAQNKGPSAVPAAPAAPAAGQ
ncbi:MAG: hypothetical protein KGI37_03785 [Alphaproteobacteria bacterium]|nr:hypothetical protein [Alphaproteobacteria bacterium]